MSDPKPVCPTCDGTGHTVSDPCEMEGCDYPAEYDGYCKWCMLAIDEDRVLADYPELEAIA